MPPTDAVNQTAQKTYKDVIKSITMDGLYQLVAWLLGNCTFIVALSNQGQGKVLAVIHRDENPKDNEFINVDIRVMGRSVLLGCIQLL